MKTIYNALILPHFDYCDVVWGNINKGLADRIQKLQNRAARVITSSNYDIRSVDILKRLNWDNLSIRRYKHKAITMFKIMHGKSPKYLQGQFEKDTVGNLYSLRNSEFKLLPPRTDALKNSSKYSGAVLWNNLPLHIRSSHSLASFRRLLDHHCVCSL